MRDPERVNRREFTVQSALAVLSGVTITISGCGGGSSSPTSPTPPTITTAPPTTTPSTVTGSVSSNHGHTATITGATLAAGNAINLDIRGSADHPHTVQLTTTDVGQIGAGDHILKDSTVDDGHLHRVTFN